uniref:Uncharacterized protein n=1 Tax=Physcomitrium patens TaxID=3218 RepID=A0A2K1J915_PHYPA|nr:hypothetical protein PHYPA_021132 [Physcomitrium patens]
MIQCPLYTTITVLLFILTLHCYPIGFLNLTIHYTLYHHSSCPLSLHHATPPSNQSAPSALTNQATKPALMEPSVVFCTPSFLLHALASSATPSLPSLVCFLPSFHHHTKHHQQLRAISHTHLSHSCIHSFQPTIKASKGREGG